MAGKPKTFSVEARDKVAALLDALEPKPTKDRGLSSADVVDSLKTKIKEAQAKGFSLDEILKMFEDGGISIGMTTLKTAMKRPRKPAKKEAAPPEVKTDTKPIHETKKTGNDSAALAKAKQVASASDAKSNQATKAGGFVKQDSSDI